MQESVVGHSLERRDRTETGAIVRVIDLVPGAVKALPSVAAESLSKEQFWSDHVSKHQPLLIKGAAKAWPAIESWPKPGYLEPYGDAEVGMSNTFNPLPPEFYFRRVVKRQKLAECLSEMHAADDRQTLSVPSVPVPAGAAGDLGEFAFLDPKRDVRPLLYPRRRLFIYKNASTEWHYHPTDETLTTQIVGAKRVSLFKLDADNWERYCSPIEHNFHHMACRASFFPQERPVVKYEGILEAGDAMYLPPFWWHGIDPVDARFGITLAHCFRTPLKRLAHWNEPAIRAVRRRLGVLGFVAVGIPTALSSLSRLIARESW